MDKRTIHHYGKKKNSSGGFPIKLHPSGVQGSDPCPPLPSFHPASIPPIGPNSGVKIHHPLAITSPHSHGITEAFICNVNMRRGPDSILRG
jgi:hypothetical protein